MNAGREVLTCLLCAIIVFVLAQLQAKGEVVGERERELAEVRTRLQGENSDLRRDLEEKGKVRQLQHLYNILSSHG